MEIEKIKITDITEAEYNPRLMQDNEMKKLENSISEFGLVDPIIINLKNNKIIGGHQRYNAILSKSYEDDNFNPELNLIRLGDIGWVFMDTELEIKDENHEKALNLALNKISGEWDYDKLQEVLKELELSPLNVELTGFDNEEIKELDTGYLEDETPVIEDNYNEENTDDTNIKHGDIFKLGNHVLICGDATSKEDLKKLLSKNSGGGLIKIDQLLTDPPYGVDYSNKNIFLNSIDKGNRVQKDIANDNIEDYHDFFITILNNTVPYLNEYNTLYIFMSGKELHNLRLAIEDTNCYCSDYLVWVKNNHVLGRKDYNSKHEFCLYGWYGKHKFYGDFSTTVLCFDKPLKNDLHPTMKPIQLLSKLIKDGSPEKGNVLDLFGGSGSTLIACEQTNRNCYMMELAPHYCQVIIDRWEQFTGKKALKLN